MKLENLQNPQKYTDLYVFDFGDYTGIGFTAEEVAELFESERYRDGKAYRIYRAHPDGTMELAGVSRGTFFLESGMFFHADSEFAARRNFNELVKLAVANIPPCKAKVHLTKFADNKFVTAIIYPAEYDGRISRWLLDGDYKTEGYVEGGVKCTEKYYAGSGEILERHQLFGKSDEISRTGENLVANLKHAVQR
jgi:hypothetical protein